MITPHRVSKRGCAARSAARSCSTLSAAGAMRPTRRSIRSSRWASSIPRNRDDAAAAIAIAREEGVPVLPRGAGTSQCGQTVARALVLDCSKYMDRVVSVDVEGRRARVEPGMVLDRLNRSLRQHKLFFPVDPSTASRATIGGMTANNSCGSRSLRYGNMVHNVRGDRCSAGRRHNARGLARFLEISTTRPCPSAIASWSAICAPCTGARRTRSTPVFRRFCAASAATTSTASTMAATTWRAFWSAPRAPSPFSTRSSSICSRSRRTGFSASAISRPSTARWTRRERSSSWVRARSSWSTAR